MVTLGLVPGPAGPNAGELEVEGDVEEGELEEAGWAELLSPPPHPVRAIEAHNMHGYNRTLGSHLAITALYLACMR